MNEFGEGLYLDKLTKSVYYRTVQTLVSPSSAGLKLELTNGEKFSCF